MSDEFLDPLFSKYFEQLNLPNLLRKSSYHELVQFVHDDLFDITEVRQKLDAIQDVQKTAIPLE